MATRGRTEGAEGANGKARRSDFGRPIPERRRQRERQRARISLAEVRRLRRFGTISESLNRFASQAEAELAELLGDKPDASASETLILRDVARLGLLLRSEFAAYLEHRDERAAQRVTALVGQRRAALQAVGLERRARELDLHGYLEAKEDGAEDPE